MEKLICAACGAPLTPNTALPFLTCEYCDTSIENKYYVAPAVKEPEMKPIVNEPAEAIEEEMAEDSSGSSLLQTLLTAGASLVAGSMRAKRTAAQRTVIHRVPVGHSQQRASRPLAPRRPPQPPHAGGISARPTRAARPGSSRPSAHPGGMRGPGSRGGRGGMGGPGGRHR